MTEKKDRRCPNCTRFNVNCFESVRTISKYATECKKYSESPQKPRKCKICNGRGLVAIGENAKGLEKCPFCKGTGFKIPTLIKLSEFLGTDAEFMVNKGE